MVCLVRVVSVCDGRGGRALDFQMGVGVEGPPSPHFFSENVVSDARKSRLRVFYHDIFLREVPHAP